MLAGGEMRVGLFYVKKGGNGYFAGANRLDSMVNQYPLYSQADEALWVAAGAYNQMGDRFENQQAADYAKIVRDYPLSVHNEEAKANLRAMGRPVPDADPVAEARMKFELDNRTKRPFMSKVFSPFSDRPDTSLAAKSGNPNQESFKPTIPLDVPDTAKGNGATANEVTIGTVANRDILDKAPDARTTAGTPPTPANPSAPAATPAADPAANLPGKPATAANGAAAPAAAAPSEGTPEANIAATAANAAAVRAKKPKPQKPVAAKRRARPADKPGDKKGTAPPPAQTTPPAAAATPAPTPAKTSGGGGAPEVPQP